MPAQNLIYNDLPTCHTRRVTLVTNLVISHKWGKDRIVIATNGIDISVVICVTDSP
jgi:hypothetical protein